MKKRLLIQTPRTGMKCLPAAKVPQAAGSVLHDWHAETVALRAFNHYLLQECLRLAHHPGDQSILIRRKELLEISEDQGLQPFTIHENLKLHMYCSEAPCGDASMELVMEAQDDPTPWPSASASAPVAVLEILKGRGYFSELGIVRRKPARPDSPRTLSKSCSDKLALKQCTSLLSSLTATLISPTNVYLDSLVLPVRQYNQTACQRSFHNTGRMKLVDQRIWAGGYKFQPFRIEITDCEFSCSRRSMASFPNSAKASNISAVHTSGLQETLINGVLQGHKQFDPKGGSALCNTQMWTVFSQVVARLQWPPLQTVSSFETYRQLKDSELLANRQMMKQEVRNCALKGWIRNEVDDFDLVHEQLGAFRVSDDSSQLQKT